MNITVEQCVKWLRDPDIVNYNFNGVEPKIQVLKNGKDIYDLETDGAVVDMNAIAKDYRINQDIQELRTVVTIII